MRQVVLAAANSSAHSMVSVSIMLTLHKVVHNTFKTNTIHKSYCLVSEGLEVALCYAQLVS